MRLSQRQRRVLEVLAHMRVPREDAWLSGRRLSVLTGAVSERAIERVQDSLLRLETRELLERGFHVERGDEVLWRITDAGREAL